MRFVRGNVAPLCRDSHKLTDGNLLRHWANLKRSCPDHENRRNLTRAYMRIRVADGSVKDLLRVVLACPPTGKPAEEWIPEWKQKPLPLPKLEKPCAE